MTFRTSSLTCIFLAASCLASAQPEIKVDWNRVERVSRTTPTLDDDRFPQRHRRAQAHAEPVECPADPEQAVWIAAERMLASGRHRETQEFTEAQGVFGASSIPVFRLHPPP